MPAFIASAGAATAVSGLSFGAYPYLSIMLLSNKDAASKAPASDLEFSFGEASLSSAATPSSYQLLPWHLTQPSRLSQEFPGHSSEAADHPNCLLGMFHHHIGNDGGQRFLLTIYVENTKAW